MDVIPPNCNPSITEGRDMCITHQSETRMSDIVRLSQKNNSNKINEI